MKVVKILRGLSGSGKSTRAELLLHTVVKRDKSWEYCSIDLYFVSNKTGVYTFNKEELNNAYLYCTNLFNKAIESNTDYIIVDNNNIRKSDYQYYIDKAKENGYVVEIEVLGGIEDIKDYAARNTHGITEEEIQEQANQWED